MSFILHLSFYLSHTLEYWFEFAQSPSVHGMEVCDSDENEISTTKEGGAMNEGAFTDGLDAEPVSQLTVVKNTKRKTWLAKKTLSCITAPIDAFKCPVDAYTHQILS